MYQSSVESCLTTKQVKGSKQLHNLGAASFVLSIVSDVHILCSIKFECLMSNTHVSFILMNKFI